MFEPTPDPQYDIGEQYGTPRGVAELSRVSRATVNGTPKYRYEVRFCDAGVTENMDEERIREKISSGAWTRL